MSPTKAAYIAKIARKALRLGLLTHHQHAVLDTLLWDIRQPGSARVTATYSQLQSMAHVCRQTVADAIQAFVTFGWLRKIRHKRLTLWANGGRRWQQLANEYVFCCESTGQTEYPKEVIQILSPEANAAAQSALEAIGARRKDAFNAAWQARKKG